MKIIASKNILLNQDSTRPSLWLILEDESGIFGIGEASPLFPFSKENIIDCQRSLFRIHNKIGAISESDVTYQNIHFALSSVKDMPSSARFAFETALLDLWGKKIHYSVSQLINQNAQPSEILTNALVSGDPQQWVKDTSDFVSQGFCAIKIKMRSQNENDFLYELNEIYKIRELFPLPFEIKIDVNAGWSLDEAYKRMEKLIPIKPSYIEQPVSTKDILSLVDAPLAWAADESLSDSQLIEQLFETPQCVAFVLKPHVHGWLHAYEIARRAQKNHKGIVITHFMDGPVALAAASELALAMTSNDRRFAMGIAPHAQLSNWPNIAISQLSMLGKVIPSTKHGLGLGFDLPVLLNDKISCGIED